jgi:uncharacterized protein (TIGR03067 family)
MRRLIAVLGLAAAASLSVRAADEDAKKLEGTYKVIEVITEGKPSPKAKELESVVIQGDTITIKISGKTKDESAKFKLDSSKKPAHIDITPDRGKKQVMGIYKTEETDKGFVLTMAFGDQRPKDFKGEGDDAMMMKLLRKKAK